jgi:diguanylate cyclase (GGDEF)-like protein
VVLFPGRSIQDAIPHLEMLRKAVEATQFTLRGRNRPEQKPKRESRSGPAGQSIAVTISIGVAEGSNRNVDPTEVITAADQALYRAKKAGRNMLSI